MYVTKLRSGKFWARVKSAETRTRMSLGCFDTEEEARAALANFAEHGPSALSFVYFVQSLGPKGWIKIGRANSVEKRMASLLTAHPDGLVLLSVVRGGKDEERRLHRRFSHLRQIGEWFIPSPELLSYIANTSIARASKHDVSTFPALAQGLRALADRLDAMQKQSA